MTVALVDYGAGNLASVRKGLEAAGAAVAVPARAADLDTAGGIVVPGVGHFAATAALDEPWRAAIRAAVDLGTPVLGICLGMQWLYEGSDEAPGLPGLGVVSGRCARIAAAAPLKVPHVGWNALRQVRPSTLLAKVPDGAFAYFTHSFAAPVTADTTAAAEHGATFAAAVERGRVYGLQFHPEKSGDAGLAMLRAFVEMTRAR